MIELKEASGRPVPDEEYVVRFPDGTERRGRLGPDGTATITDAPPGEPQVFYPRHRVQSPPGEVPPGGGRACGGSVVACARAGGASRRSRRRGS